MAAPSSEAAGLMAAAPVEGALEAELSSAESSSEGHTRGTRRALVLGGAVLLVAGVSFVAAAALTATPAASSAPDRSAEAGSTYRPAFLSALAQKQEVTITDGTGFNCESGFGNWREGWSASKKRYCCKAVERGCEVKTSIMPALWSLIVGLLIFGTGVYLAWACLKKSKESNSKWGRMQKEQNCCGSGRCCPF